MSQIKFSQTPRIGINQQNMNLHSNMKVMNVGKGHLIGIEDIVK